MRSIVLLLFTNLVPLMVLSGEKPSPVNQYVQAVVSMKQKTLKPGASGELIITLKPKPGIHVNLEPPIDVKLDSSAGVASVRTLDIPKSHSKYLDPRKPLRQRFTLANNLKPGPLVLTGVLTYFYCSDSARWCSRFKQPIEVKVTIVR